MTGQAIYWGTMWVSVWNLVIIAYERFLAVCHPFKHQDFTKTKAYIAILIGYPLSVIVTTGAYVQVSFCNINILLSCLMSLPQTGGESNIRSCITNVLSSDLLFII